MGIMGTFLLLAAEANAVHSELAEGAAEGGFGLNLDIFETNLINLAILIGILFYFGRKVLSNILNERQSNIATAIQEAEGRLKEASTALSQAQEQLKQSQAEAERIRQSAVENAQKAKEALLAKAVQDVERLKQTAAADLNSETDRAIAQLRQRVATLALQKVESQLKSGIADDAQQGLIDRSIAQLGGNV
ncbi:F0F1 ATP synthase subunit B [Nostoc sp. 'Lobaria pulmonaria (5183) cyanobiont']|uniref:F0F1 ATP synthase subunit B n=1 Tax=Nostoc sp. 'Lobaria pulmonaria (5183) cyanobiont' TaxID=1618022 RepID=UPI000CF3402C|nr:F0F1 ATP synthase subunit B [Nostoc sp. 'Lobaria pulmonaria (5183) cyanobiont']AVH72360.1 F0F1 ATP synthase subunit B [Nostoc sp. 'Lobaria pulmonaria (5183) cyanobiont']